MPKATKSTDALPARITAAGLARLFGISVQRLGQLADQGAVVRADRNAYALRRSIGAYTAHLRRAASGGSGAADAALSAERTRWTRARADLAEADRRVQIGDLVSVDDVDAAWAFVATNVRTRILAVSNKLGGRLGAEAAALIRTELHEALQAISATEPPRIARSNRRRHANGNDGIEAHA